MFSFWKKVKAGKLCRKKPDHPRRHATRPYLLIWAMENICGTNYVVCSHWTIMFPTHDDTRYLQSDHIRWETAASGCFSTSLAPSLPLLSLSKDSQEDIIENIRATHQRMDGEGRRGRGGGGTINAWPDVCRSLVWLAGICRLAAVAKEEDEEEWRWTSNQELIIPQDIGRMSDCRFCIIYLGG